MLSIIILALTCLVNLVLGGLVLMRNPRLTSGRAFFAISFFICLWGVSNYLTGLPEIGLNADNFFNRLAFLAGFLVILSGVWFSYNFSVVPKLKGASLFALILASICVILLSPSNLIAGQVTTNGRILQFSVGPLLVVFILALVVFFGVIIRNLMYVLARKHGKEREQAIYLLIGFSVPALLGIVTNTILPLATSSWSLTGFGPLFTVFLVAVIAYTMTRHQLFDIHLFVLRAAAYLTTLFAITFIFITPFVLLISRLVGSSLSFGQIVLVVALSICLLYALQFMRVYFDKITTRLFFRHDYDLQDVQDTLADILVRTADLKVLRENTANVLSQALKTRSLRFVLFSDFTRKDVELARRIDSYGSPSKPNLVIADDIPASADILRTSLRKEGVALAVKLRTTHEDLGYMILGHKQSGELYTPKDLRLLSVAADEIAISLQNALRFEEIQRFNITLQEEVDNATSKLRRANKHLEELDNTKDDFISMASHQLRTPLTSVKGYLSMVLEGDAGKITHQQSMMLKQAFTSSQRMVFLITDLLNVSRLKTGKFLIDAIPTDLSALVEEEVGQLSEAAQVKGIDLEYKKPKNFPWLMMDDVKIRQVIMNFIDNAIYYTPSGGNIKVELADKPSTVELRVIDDGIGVPRDEQHHLFTKFYRATNARKARPDGTGLGLFMAQKVIAAQGGSVIFSSREHHGSTFGFTFSKHRLRLREPARLAVHKVAATPKPREPAQVR